MSEDIKEILDYYKKDNEKFEEFMIKNFNQHQLETTFHDMYQRYRNHKLLLDYITNLQTIEQQYSAILSENAELENKITNLQKENERLKELDENYPIEEQFEEALKGEKEYKSRIDKAVEYIKERYDYILKCDFLDHDEQVDKRQITYLLNILKGE